MALFRDPHRSWNIVFFLQKKCMIWSQTRKQQDCVVWDLQVQQETNSHKPQVKTISSKTFCNMDFFDRFFGLFAKGNPATWWWREPKNIVRGLGSSRNTHCSTLIRSLHATLDQDDRIDINKDKVKDHENFTSASLWLAKEGFPRPPGSLLLRRWSK